jgi:hypothetical protein
MMPATTVSNDRSANGSAWAVAGLSSMPVIVVPAG